MTLVFASAAFLSALLLFTVEPMIARLILPRLGGAPAVWNTCMMFFQSALLAGYTLAHGISRRLSPLQQRLLFMGLFILGAIVLPIRLGHAGIGPPPTQSNPIPWLLGTLGIAVGLPFLVLSAIGPLVQYWFADRGDKSQHDPYFLYAASNLGSLIALVAYPALWEPVLTLGRQSVYWSIGYAALGFLLCTTAVQSYRALSRTLRVRCAGPVAASAALAWRRRLRWLALASVPSSLMLGVTSYLSTDIASVPLLWVIPLALYLLSFVIVFSYRSRRQAAIIGRIAPAGALVLILLILFEDLQPAIGMAIAIHLAVFLLLALLCHGRLADDRPDASHLTEFYLWVALGGVLGGVLNALVAPLVFPRIIEYPLAVIAACWLRPGVPTATRRQRQLDWLLPAGLAVLTAILVLALARVQIDPPQVRAALMFAGPAVLAYTLVDRSFRYGLGLAALWLAGFLYPSAQGRAIRTERSFYGVHRVTLDPTGRFHLLIHGNTVHGRECFSPGKQDIPLAYYEATGPAGLFFQAMAARLHDAKIGGIGLGAGSLAAYAETGQSWTFYEIDPAVARIARDPEYFTFLSHCKAKDLTIVLGDGRLQIAKAKDHRFDLLILDAFSSDSVPIHLLTREAMEIYLSKLAPKGGMLFHISNRYLDLKPVLAALALDSGLESRFYDDLEIGDDQRESGKDPSQWVLLTRGTHGLEKLLANPRWRKFQPEKAVPVWTDDFSSIVALLKWN